MSLEGTRIGFAVSGSFCTFKKAFAQAERLRDMGARLTPVMSFNASGLDTRFGKAADNLSRLEEICGRKAILTLEQAEPIGPKAMFDLFIIAPCTATTMGKLAGAIYDTPLISEAVVKLQWKNQPSFFGTADFFTSIFYPALFSDLCGHRPRQAP